MQSSTLLKDTGMRILSEQLGLVEAERFIALIRQDSFDYTEWRQGLFNDVGLDQFLKDAVAYGQKFEEAEAEKAKD